MPGAGSIYTISTGLFRGWRSSISAAFGCTAGIIPHLLFSILVLSSVYEYSTEAFQAIKYIGAVYLLYLAYSMWKESGRSEFSEKPDQKKDQLKIIINAVFINLFNPKLSIFFLKHYIYAHDFDSFHNIWFVRTQCQQIFQAVRCSIYLDTKVFCSYFCYPGRKAVNNGNLNSIY